MVIIGQKTETRHRRHGTGRGRESVQLFHTRSIYLNEAE